MDKTKTKKPEKEIKFFEFIRKGDPAGTFRTCMACGYPHKRLMKERHPEDKRIQEVRDLCKQSISMDPSYLRIGQTEFAKKILSILKK